jgi:hypothetical protein
MLGHASATMALDTYAGLFDTDAQALADRMDEARERAISESCAHCLPAWVSECHPASERIMSLMVAMNCTNKGVGQVGLEPTTDGL